MSGFDDGSLQGGLFFQAKQFGSILRGSGPPVPPAGVVGDLYIDTLTFQLFNKRASDDTDPWGHYIFSVPLTYQSTLKWFSSSYPEDSIGVTGDYCLLWGGYNNYGMQPSIFGPKQSSGWPENGNGPGTIVDPTYAGYTLPVGASDESTPSIFSTSMQLIAAGAADEYILATPVLLPTASSPVDVRGAMSYPAQVTVTLNPLYTATDEHGI
jgi:hypothetical protein